jgi:hypothetical protein
MSEMNREKQERYNALIRFLSEAAPELPISEIFKIDNARTESLRIFEERNTSSVCIHCEGKISRLTRADAEIKPKKTQLGTVCQSCVRIGIIDVLNKAFRRYRVEIRATTDTPTGAFTLTDEFWASSDVQAKITAITMATNKAGSAEAFAEMCKEEAVSLRHLPNWIVD